MPEPDRDASRDTDRDADRDTSADDAGDPAAPRAEAFLDLVPGYGLYALSTRGDAAVPGYWAGFRPGLGGPTAGRISFLQAWNDLNGLFLFCGSDPTSGPDADTSAFLRALPGKAEPGVRMLWIDDPNRPAEDWLAHPLYADPLGGTTWRTTRDAVFDLGGYRIAIARFTDIVPPAANDPRPVLRFVNGGGRPLTVTAPSGQVYASPSPAAVVPLAGPAVGSFDSSLELGPSDRPGVDGFARLGVELRYAMPDPDDPTGRAVRTVPMPVMYQGTNTFSVALTVDPALPLEPGRTWIGLLAATAPRGPGQVLDSPLRTVLGHPVRIAPTKPAAGPLRPARLVFGQNPTRADHPDAPASPSLPRSYHLSPDGCFTVSVGQSTDTSLPLGLSGSEYVVLPSNPAGLLHFAAGNPAYAFAPRPSASGTGTGAGAGAGNVDGEHPNEAAPVLSAAATTAYVSVLPSEASPQGLIYFAAPQNAPWFSDTLVPAKPWALPVAIPALRLPGYPPAAGRLPAAFPVGWFGAVEPALARFARQIEQGALAPARQAIIHASAGRLDAAAEPELGGPAATVTVLTPQGLSATIENAPAPEQTRWHSLDFAALPGTTVPRLTLTSIGPRLRAAVQAPELFCVIADAEEYLADSSVRYGIDPTILRDLEALGLPPEALRALNQMDPAGYDDEDTFRAAIPEAARAYEDTVVAAAGLLKATVDGWTVQLSPRAWRTGDDAPTMLVVKSAGGSLAELAARPGGWGWPEAAGDPDEASERLGRIIAAAAEAPPGSPEEAFSREIAHNPAWNGVLVFNAPVIAADLPPELGFVTAGIDPGRFYAHHLAFPLTQLLPGAGGARPGATRVRGLIDYRDTAAQAPPDAPPFAFRTRALAVRFDGSAVSGLSVRVALLVNRLFGDQVAIGGAVHGNNLILTGGYQLRDGAPGYALTLDGPARLELAASALESVEITAAGLRTAMAGGGGDGSGSDSGGTGDQAVEFSLSGLLRFRWLDGFDVFCYGTQGAVAEGREPRDGYLRFSGLTVRMGYDPARIGEQHFTVDEGRVALDPAGSLLRPGALAERFPIRATGLLAVPAPPDAADPDAPPEGSGRRPEDLGFLGVLAPIDLAAPRTPWYGLTFALDLGSVGALAGSAGLSATLLAAWSPGTVTETPAGNATARTGPVYLGIRFGDAPDPGAGPTLQGVIRLGFGGAEFLIVPAGADGPDTRFEYLLRLNRLALSVLGLNLPPGGVDLVVFGDPHGDPQDAASSPPGWYAAYRKQGSQTRIPRPGNAAVAGSDGAEGGTR
ncbi:hypothetical protein ABH920_003733 [Catenulispora sp. EB89]|uniref:hypothetical protein n=1 Tax=Catenulispora sp. EB89 TaxID=3156257 RepID=UPI003515350A